jgi:YgiT-type zinc finger domain-containing protein
MTGKNIKPNLMICDICGVRAGRVVKRDKVFGKGRKMIVIEDIPFISCRNCGQTYITREVMLTLDKIRTHSDTMTVPKEVAYAKIA